jgi:hypothetical protein
VECLCNASINVLNDIQSTLIRLGVRQL